MTISILGDIDMIKINGRMMRIMRFVEAKPEEKRINLQTLQKVRK
jgi:hypothetical protein